MGVTGAQWTVIYLLHEQRAQTVNEVARAVGVDSGAASRLVGRLIDKGLIVLGGTLQMIIGNARRPATAARREEHA